MRPKHWNFLRGNLLLALVLAASFGQAASTPAPTWDLLLLGGRVVAGAGNPWFRADVAIRGDRMVSIGPDLQAGMGVSRPGSRSVPVSLIRTSEAISLQ